MDNLRTVCRKCHIPLSRAAIRREYCDPRREFRAMAVRCVVAGILCLATFAPVTAHVPSQCVDKLGTALTGSEGAGRHAERLSELAEAGYTKAEVASRTMAGVQRRGTQQRGAGGGTSVCECQLNFATRSFVFSVIVGTGLFPKSAHRVGGRRGGQAV